MGKIMLDVRELTTKYVTRSRKDVYAVDHVSLQIEEGKDLCTLITCTPYGINTHRLLVRAHRIDNADGNAMIVADAIQIRPIYIVPFLLIPILLLLIIFVIIQTSAKRRQKNPA